MENDGKSGIVAFAFGIPWDIDSNWQIAQIALKKAIEFNAPIFTQDDIAIENRAIDVTHTFNDVSTGNPPSTLQISRRAVMWAKEYKINKLWIAAAKPHLWRCLRDLKQAVLEAGIKMEVYACDERINSYPEDSWFCINSEQKHTRSKEEWDKREGVLRRIPFFLYKWITK